MNKDNIFKSSPFFMQDGDILHIIIKDETGTGISIQLEGEDEGIAPSAPIIEDATSVTGSSFTANWTYAEGADGYYLDVSTDTEFSYLLPGYSDKDVSSIDNYSITGLAEGTTYYYRVRSYNDYGTSDNSGTATVTTTATAGLVDLDGNEYTSVRIGNQEWIVENFRCTKYTDGSAIPNITGDAEWVADGPGNQKNYGALYNWYAATDARGIAQSEWHVPLQADFSTLEAYLGGSSVAGGKLKETGTTYWTTPNTGATNETGFNARGGGVRTSTFTGRTSVGKYWTSTAASSENGAVLALQYDTAASFLGQNYKYNGHSIRLLKDSTTLSDGETSTYTGKDGKVYGTVCIGTQEWMSENLDETLYQNGDTIAVVTDDSAWAALTDGAMCYYNNDAGIEGGAYCWYDNDISYKEDYGALYNYYAVGNVKEIAYLERGGVQETGWSIPTLAQYLTLFSAVGGLTVAGAKLRETGTTHWETDEDGATDEYGFNGRGAGYRFPTTGGFDDLLERFNLWTSTVLDDGRYAVMMYTGSDNFEPISANNNHGFSVRLVRDYPTGNVTCDRTDITCDSFVVTCDME